MAPNEHAPLLSHPYVPPSATTPDYPHSLTSLSSSAHHHPISISSHTASAHDITSSHMRTPRPKPSSTWASLLWSALRWVVYLTFLSTFLTCLYLTLVYHDAACEHPLPLVTLIVGITGCVWLLVIPYQVQLEEHAPLAWEGCCIRITWALRLTCLLTLLVTNSMASAWVFGMDSGQGMVCPRPLYWFTFCMLVGWWAVVGVGTLVLLGLITVMCVAFMR